MKSQNRFLKSKKVYILPNLFTTANMFCGFFSMVAAINSHYVTAAWVVLVAMIFDSMDGRVARMTRSTSDFGLQYDSLSDLISFGVAPSVLIYLWAMKPYGRLGWLVAFFFMVCVALRLARFNSMVHVIPKSYFQGVPSPLGACLMASSILFYHEMKLEVSPSTYIIPLALVTASLMVSTFRFPSFKEFRIHKENSFGVFALIALCMTLIAVKPEITLFVMSLLYVAISLVYDVFCKIFRREKLLQRQETKV